jgi:hypothetical protein
MKNTTTQPFDEAAYQRDCARQRDELETLLRAGSQPTQSARSAPMQHVIRELIEQAKSARGGIPHFDGNGEVRAVTPRTPAASGTLRLADAFPVPSGNLARSLNSAAAQGQAPGSVNTFGSAVLNDSRFLQAGGRLVSFEPVKETVGGAMAFAQRPARFEILTAPSVAILPDGDDVAVGSLPIESALVNLSDAPNRAVFFNLTRAQQKSRPEAEWDFLVAHSLGLALARSCDEVALGAIAAGASSTWSLASAAARGHRVADLRAIAGTSAAGATFAPDGTLRVAGIRAEITNAIAATVAGSFSRAAVALHDSMHLIVKRNSVEGDVQFILHFTIHALVPNASADFGLVAA